MTVDAHAHIVVPEITADGAPDEPWRPRLFWRDGRQVVEINGRPITAVPREFARIEGIIEAQERAGISRTVLCPWVSLLRYDADADEGLRTCRIYNEALAGLVRRSGGRLGALGMVPLQDPELAARELEVIAGMGLAGAEVAASVRGAYLGDDRFRPFWAAAEEADALVFVHPSTRGLGQAALADYFLWNSVGNPTETAIAAAHMIVAGVMEAHPRLKVLLAHGGGTILHLRGRLHHAHRVSPQARSRLRGSVDDSLRRFYYDTITHDDHLLRDLVDYVGADHVLLGSDYPFDMGVERPADQVRSLGLPPDAEAQVLGGNAQRLGLVGPDG